LLYLHVENISTTLERAMSLGGKELYPATFHADLGFAVAEIEDSEGNRIGLHQKL
ncbi:MAG TPA: VOC family protein, partial [Sphingobacterium sp.]|nr:VOC family protein [Sphingobacterium sp.]